MTGSHWNKSELNLLKNAWNNRDADVTLSIFAKQYASIIGRSEAAIMQKVIAQPEYRVPTSTRTAWNNPPILEGDSLVLMDTQIPYHHAEFINKCLTVCRKWNIRQLILGGDALDLNALNEFAPNFENDSKRVIDHASSAELIMFAETLPADKREKLYSIIGEAEEDNSLGGEIKESRAILKTLEKEFDNITWIMGNHEQRILRLLKKIMPVSSLATLFGADSPKWNVSPYYYCILKSGGEEWQIEHPINTGKGSSKKLAPKYGRHIIMGHNHHFSITTDPSGKLYAIEPGMAMDEERMAYATQRHNAADAHLVGAVIVRNGKPTPLNKFTDWELLA